MSIESRLDNLEEKYRNHDADLHSLARVCADIKNIALTNQHDIAGVKVDVAGLKTDIAGIKKDSAETKACIAALAEATYAGFKRTDEKIDQLEQKLDTRTDQIDERIDKLEAKFDTRFDQLDLLIRQLHPSN